MEKGEIGTLQVNEQIIEETLGQEYQLNREEQRKLVEEQIFIPSPKEMEKVRLNGRIYGLFIEQPILFSKVGKVLGIPVKRLRQQEGENLFNQSLLRKSFSELTGFPAYWDNLQWFLDYVATYMYGKKEGYQYDSYTEYRIRTIYNQIDFRLKGALEIAFRKNGTSSKNQIPSSEFSKRMERYRRVVLKEMDTDLIELALAKESEEIIPEGPLDEHKINIYCKRVKKPKKFC